MKNINLKLSSSIDYPVGEHIQVNIPVIKAVVKAIKSQLLNTTNRVVFVCMGSSGAIIAAICSCEINNSIIIHIKKNGEKSHSGNNVKFDVNDYIIIVDDFVASGSTLRSIYDAIKDEIYGTIHLNCIALCGRGGHYDVIVDLNPDVVIFSDLDDY